MIYYHLYDSMKLLDHHFKQIRFIVSLIQFHQKLILLNSQNVNLKVILNQNLQTHELWVIP